MGTTTAIVVPNITNPDSEGEREPFQMIKIILTTVSPSVMVRQGLRRVWEARWVGPGGSVVLGVDPRHCDHARRRN